MTKLERVVYCGLWMILLSIVSTHAAPVQTASHQDQAQNEIQPKQPEALDSEASELEGLTQTDNEKTKPEVESVEEVQGEEEQPETSDTQELPEIVAAPEEAVPAKRQLPMFSKTVIVPSNRLPVNLQPANDLYEYPTAREYPIYQQEEVRSVYGAVPDVDLSPRAVAEYLIVTKDFDGFDQALTDLIQSGVLSPDEVYQYKATVSWQYDELLRQLENTEVQYFQQDLSRPDPLEYLEQNYLQTENLPIYNVAESTEQQVLPRMSMDNRLPLGTLSQQYQDYGIQAIPIAERRTERIQKLLLAKQQNLDGILDVVLNEYYSQPQETTYNTDYLDTLTSNNDFMNDPDLAQLMEYLQESLNTEAEQQQEQEQQQQQQQQQRQQQQMMEGSTTTEEEEEKEEEEEPAQSPVDNTPTLDVANELESLPAKQTVPHEATESETEETSGDEEDRKLNETKVKVTDTSSSSS